MRGIRRARRIRRQLGGEEALVAPFPPKPPRVRWTRYDGLREEGLAAERAWLRAQRDYTLRLLQRLGLQPPPPPRPAV